MRKMQEKEKEDSEKRKLESIKKERKTALIVNQN